VSITAQEKIGDNLAAGVVAIINGDQPDFPFQAFGPRMTESMPKSRAEVRAGGFVRASDQMAQNAAGAWYYAHRRGFLSCTIVSQRHTQTAQAPDNKHAEAVGRFRDLMSIVTRALQPSTVSEYQVIDAQDQGDTYVSDETTRTDRTTVTFAVELWLAPAQYAAV
jgi:hypothetical protein